jgi:2-dehydropantoate 2-reductase
MEVLIYGSGAVGIGIAAALYEAGAKVSLKASKATKEIIDQQGIERRGILKKINVPRGNIEVCEHLSEIKNKKFDFIIVSTKTTSNKESAEEIGANAHLLKKDGEILLFQNGWGNDEAYLKYFEKERIDLACILVGFKRVKRNISEVTVFAEPIAIGGLYKENNDNLKELALAITEGGINCEVSENIVKAIWAKMLYNCTLNPLGAVLGVNYGKLTESENSIFIMNKIIQEIFSVIEVAGYSTYWDNAEEYKVAFYGKLLPSTYEHRSSTLQDIERKIKTEIDSLTGSIVRLGESNNVPVPFNTMIYNLIKTMESYF